MRILFLSLLLCAAQTMTGCSNQTQTDTIPQNKSEKTEAVDGEKAPKGKLIYCSYASVGHAALGTDYCELIADPGTTPKIVVVKDEDCHFAEPVRGEFEVDESVVAQLQEGLANLKAWKTDGYNKTDDMDGGRSHRFHIEYDSGEKIHASWFTHKVKPEAQAVYNYLESFFSPWYKQVHGYGEIQEDEVVEEPENP